MLNCSLLRKQLILNLMKVCVNIDSYFWNKESNLLFDYDSLGSSQQDTIKVEEEGKLAKSGKNITFLSKMQEKDLEKKDWIKFLDFQFGKDIVSINDTKSDTEKMFVSIKHTFQHKTGMSGLKLKEGDCLKFGKILFKCKEIKIINSAGPDCNLSKLKEKTLGDNYQDDNIEGGGNFDSDVIRETNSNLNLLLLQNKNKKQNKNCICRFCLCEDEGPENPLIAPCKCSGTMKHIHIDCLKSWLKSKINVKSSTFMISYTFKPLMCELCLTPVPMRFKFKGRIHDLINMATPECTYLVLEQVTKEDSDKTYCLIIFKQKGKLTVGRSNESDVRLSDISISRHHANLYERSNGIFLEDNDSKFGSLNMLDTKVQLILLKPLGIQMGKHFFLITLTQNLISKLCCLK